MNTICLLYHCKLICSVGIKKTKKILIQEQTMVAH